MVYNLGVVLRLILGRIHILQLQQQPIKLILDIQLESLRFSRAVRHSDEQYSKLRGR